MALQTTISSLELRIKDLSAMAPQKDGPGYQEDENIDKILLTKLDLKQLVTLINTLARQTNIHLRTFLLHNKGATTPKPKQVERKPRGMRYTCRPRRLSHTRTYLAVAPAAPKAPPKNIVLAKTVDTSGPLSTNDLEAARTYVATHAYSRGTCIHRAPHQRVGFMRAITVLQALEGGAEGGGEAAKSRRLGGNFCEAARQPLPLSCAGRFALLVQTHSQTSFAHTRTITHKVATLNAST